MKTTLDEDFNEKSKTELIENAVNIM